MSALAPIVVLDEERHTAHGKNKTHIIFGTFVAFMVFIVIAKLIIDNCEKKDEIIHEVGVSLPENWYYDRSSMGMPACEEDEPKMRGKVLVGYIGRHCSDVESCVAVVRPIANEANFFISGDHVFEGYGWKCNVTDVIAIKFIGPIDWNETLVYHVLLKSGIENQEISPTMRLLIDNTSCQMEACSMLLSLTPPPQNIQ